MPVLSSQLRVLEPVKTFQKGPRPEKAKQKQWLTYSSQFRFILPPYARHKK